MTPDEAGPPGSFGYEMAALLEKLRREGGLLGRALAWHYERRWARDQARRDREFWSNFRQVREVLRRDTGL